MRLAIAFAIGICPQTAPAVALADVPPSAVQKMLAPGSEGRQLKALEGTYDVLITMWPKDGAKPVVTTRVIATRKMIGNYLQETMQPAPGGTMPDFRRIDYLNFDRVEGRWKYVSMDTRFPVSIMPASSFGPAQQDGTIRLRFEPQGFVGFGPEVEGRFMLSNMTLGDLHQGLLSKEQRFIVASGGGKPWLFIRYEYTRRPSN